MMKGSRQTDLSQSSGPDLVGLSKKLCAAANQLYSEEGGEEDEEVTADILNS